MSTSTIDASSADDARERWTAVFIGVLAVLLAICSMGGGNASKDGDRANIDATNTWAFFQAKNIRRQSIRLAADDLDLRLRTEPGLSPEARAAIEAKVKEYQDQAQKLTTDPERKEGLDELYAKGKQLEAARDAAMARDPYFDWAQAFLQIAIVIASVSIVSRSRMLIALAAALGLAGTLLMLDGFTMLVRLPLLST